MTAVRRLAIGVFFFFPWLAMGVATDETAERDFHSPTNRLATGIFSLRSRPSGYEWPVDVLSIGHTMASYQNYGGEAYFHHGLDIRAAAGSPVFAAAGGKVVNIENYAGGKAYWEIAILDADGFLWQYHHIDPSTFPQTVKDAYKTGALLPEGTRLGSVYKWPISSFGERYHHIHLNVLGAKKEYLNPFAFLKPLNDTAAPFITDISLWKNGAKPTGDEVTGKYTIVAEMGDLILHKRFTVPPNSIEMEIDGSKPVTVWKFDRLPGGASNTDFVNVFFVEPLTCGNYTCRKLTVDLGFELVPTGSVFPSSVGKHHLRLTVKDFVGNSSQKDFDWTVR